MPSGNHVDPIIESAGGGWGSTIVITLLVGAVAFLLGTAADALGDRGADEPVTVPVPCDGRQHCIPDLPLSAVIATLADHGFECEERDGALADWRECELLIGSSLYSVTMRGHDDRVASYTARVLPYTNWPGADDQQAAPVSSTGEEYLRWMATLPFGEDPNAAAAAQQWLADHLEVGPTQSTDVHGFDYRLDASKDGGVSLHVDGGRG